MLHAEHEPQGPLCRRGQRTEVAAVVVVEQVAERYAVHPGGGVGRTESAKPACRDRGHDPTDDSHGCLTGRVQTAVARPGLGTTAVLVAGIHTTTGEAPTPGLVRDAVGLEDHDLGRPATATVAVFGCRQRRGRRKQVEGHRHPAVGIRTAGPVGDLNNIVGQVGGVVWAVFDATVGVGLECGNGILAEEQ